MLSFHVIKKLRDFTLDAELSVKEGETLVLIGENGAGKSTILNIISGLLNADEGRISLNERILYSSEKNISMLPEERNIGHLFQSYALFPHMSVYDNVAFGLKCRNISRSDIDLAVREQLDAMHVSEYSSVNVKDLSGGQRQRVALARSLVLKPELLLLDEPLSAVDVGMQVEMRRELRQRIHETNIPCIIVTHTLTDALELGDRVAILEEGKIIQEGRPEEVCKCPASGFVARFTGVENLFRGYAEKNDDATEITVGPITFFAVTDLEGEVLVGIRSEEILLSRELIHSTARNVLKGKIIDIQWNGPLSKVTVDVGVLIAVIITRKSADELSPVIGDDIYVIFKVSAVHVFLA